MSLPNFKPFGKTPHKVVTMNFFIAKIHIIEITERWLIFHFGSGDSCRAASKIGVLPFRRVDFFGFGLFY